MMGEDRSLRVTVGQVGERRATPLAAGRACLSLVKADGIVTIRVSPKATTPAPP